MLLGIDLSERGTIRLTLPEKNAQYKREDGNRKLLNHIAAFLLDHRLNPTDISGIGVVMNTGSFSSTRVSATIANTWAYAAGIGVVAVNADEAGNEGALKKKLEDVSGRYVLPAYAAEPHIGIAKKSYAK